jgi:membrane associated rhomboid family serine protease
MFPPVVKNLLIANVVFFIGGFVIQNALQIDIAKYLGLHYFLSKDFKIYQLVTYLFLHGGFMHIFFNMFALWMFGNVLENFWGSKRFLIFYTICGIGAGITQEVSLYFYFHHIQNALAIYSQSPDAVGFDYITNTYFQGISGFTQPVNGSERMAILSQLYQFIIDSSNTIGASGAIFGVLLAFGMLFPNTELFLMFIPIPIKAKYAVIGYGLIELYSGIRSSTGDNVAHFAHLGGMLFGFIMIMYWRRNRTL